ncbi:MAG: hypothetical protein ACNI26_07810 [Terasakiella sp.]|uniref:hypothetical protein n=1 Tax=unclassified Terasakiella TaxID=2614952 RepID=UPI003AFF8795
MLKYLKNTFQYLEKYKLDIISILGILFFSFVVSVFYLKANFDKGQFYQYQFTPAVTHACGHGYINIEITKSTKTLESFLNQESSSFSCNGLNSGYREVELNGMQRGHYYLMMAVSYAWQMSGSISWKTLIPYFAVFYAFSIVTCFLLFRTLLTRPFAICGALFLTLSDLYLSYIINFRDFSKAPSLILAVALSISLIKSKNYKTQLLLSTATGILIGASLGFRMDVMVLIPITLLALIFFVNLPITLRGAYLRLLLIFTFLGSFWIVALPILNLLEGVGGNFFHVALLGLSSFFDSAIGMTNGLPIIPYSNDVYVEHTVNAWYSDTPDRIARFVMGSPEYDITSQAYYFHIANYFPADFFLSGIASIRNILNLFFLFPSDVFGYNFLSDAIKNTPIWLKVFIAVTPLITAVFQKKYGARFALYIIFLVGYIGGASSLQYHPRHTFYALAFSIFLLLTSCQIYWNIIKFFFKNSLGKTIDIIKPKLIKENFIGIFLVLAFVFIIPTIIYKTLLIFQDYKTVEIQEEYLDLKLEPTPLKRSDTTSYIAYQQDHSMRDNFGKDFFYMNYIALDLDASACKNKDLNLYFAYDAPNTYLNFSKTFSISLDKDYRFFVPTFVSGKIIHRFKFEKLLILKEDEKCISRISRVATNEKPPFVMALAVPLQKNQITALPHRTLYKNYLVTQRSYDGNILQFGLNKLRNYYFDFEGQLSTVDTSHADIYDQAITLSQTATISYDGIPQGVYSYLLSVPQPSISEYGFRISGEIEKGTIAIGTINSSGNWEWQTPVSKKFKLAGQVPPNGKVLITAYSIKEGAGTPVKFKISKFEWLKK